MPVQELPYLWLFDDTCSIVRHVDGITVLMVSPRVYVLALARVYKAVRGGCDTIAVKIMKGQQDPRSADLFAREVCS